MDASWPYPNFSRAEMACHQCAMQGRFNGGMRSDTMHKLQSARDIVGKPFKILSPFRCLFHNGLIGGSIHNHPAGVAVDISTAGHDRGELYRALKEAGFVGFGFYKTFIHVDTRRNRRWFGQGGNDQEERIIWQSYL